MAIDFQALISDPRFLDFSLGLLAQSGTVVGRPAPSTLQAIGIAGLNAFGTSQDRQRNQLVRDQLAERARKNALLRQVPGLLGDEATEGQKKLIGLLGDVAPELLLPQLVKSLFSEPDKPTGLAAKLDTIEGRIGRPLNDEEILKLSGGGTTINIGDKLNEPIPVSQLASVRLPDGKSVPIGTTFLQARDVGAQVVSPDERKSKENARSAKALLDQLDALATGPEGIFNQVEPGFFNRAGAALQFALEDIDQPGAGKVSRFKDLSLGSISKFVRTMGETGALADGDVQRALGLLPRLFPLPDTGRVARDKLRELRQIINKGVRNNNVQNPVSDAGGTAQPGVSSDTGNTLSGLLSDAGTTISGLTAQVPSLLADAGNTVSGLAAQVPGLLSDASETAGQLPGLLSPNIPQPKTSKSNLSALVDKLRETRVLTAGEVEQANRLLSGTLTADKFKELQKILSQASLRTQKTINLNNGFTLEVLDD